VVKQAHDRSQEFAEKLLEIFEPKLSKLPEEEQEKRIAAFEKKAAKIYRDNRTKAARPSGTLLTSRRARSRG